MFLLDVRTYHMCDKEYGSHILCTTFEAPRAELENAIASRTYCYVLRVMILEYMAP